MSTEKLLGFITGIVVAFIIVALALNGKVWYNQFFKKNKKK